MYMHRLLIRATAPPMVGNQLFGERPNHTLVRTSVVTACISWGGIALVATRHHWYLVLYPTAPAQEAAHGQ